MQYSLQLGVPHAKSSNFTRIEVQAHLQPKEAMGLHTHNFDIRFHISSQGECRSRRSSMETKRVSFPNCHRINLKPVAIIKTLLTWEGDGNYRHAQLRKGKKSIPTERKTGPIEGQPPFSSNRCTHLFESSYTLPCILATKTPEHRSFWFRVCRYQNSCEYVQELVLPLAP
ncbi:hypothetical protein CC80DRAFT_97145 [Byssothecium circinans]|uniref:Uncharacterized protein n=1 Tax=Byssothecium circinans TaxID=147558 RepID=A0A6A5UNV9_9PLEO|nr:hypothetical protein CC80DRAFT_97145 [Byssothecium circinans]